MPFSNLEKDILAWMEARISDPVLRHQIRSASFEKRHATEAGIFVTLSLPENIAPVKGALGDVQVLPGPGIEIPDYPAGADSVMYVTNGKCDELEIFAMGKAPLPQNISGYRLF